MVFTPVPPFFFQLLMWRLPKLPLVFWFFGILVSIIAFLLTGVVLNMTQVFGFVFVIFCYFGDINHNGWMPFLTASLVLFDFLRSLGLDLGLSLRLTYISKREIVSELSLVSILMVPTKFIFFCGFIAF